MEEILKEFDELYRPEIGSTGMEFDRYKRKRNWFKEKLTKFEKQTKEDFLKKILPEEKSNLFLTRGCHPEEFIGKDLAYPYNYCRLKILDNANKEGINLK